MWFSVALVKFHWFGINWHGFTQSKCGNCCLYIIIQKIAPQAKSGKYFQIWFFPRFGGKNGGVLSMRMQVILDSSFARPGSAPIWGGKKGEFRDWTSAIDADCVRPDTIISFVISEWLLPELFPTTCQGERDWLSYLQVRTEELNGIYREHDLNPWLPDLKSDALTTEPNRRYPTVVQQFGI